MYLGRLNLEEKHSFLDLETYIAKTDGDFSDSEKEIIDAHCIEMHIDNNGYEPEKSLDEVLRSLRQMSQSKRYIVFLEITATVLADEVYQDCEKMLLSKLAQTLEIHEKEIQNAMDIMRDLKKDYSRCAAFIGE